MERSLMRGRSTCNFHFTSYFTPCVLPPYTKCGNVKIIYLKFKPLLQTRGSLTSSGQHFVILTKVSCPDHTKMSVGF